MSWSPLNKEESALRRLRLRPSRATYKPHVKKRSDKLIYCVNYVRPKRGRRWEPEWSEFTTTGVHVSGCFDVRKDATRRLRQLQDAGKCVKWCAIYARKGKRTRMIWPRAAKHWKDLYPLS